MTTMLRRSSRNAECLKIAISKYPEWTNSSIQECLYEGLVRRETPHVRAAAARSTRSVAENHRGWWHARGRWRACPSPFRRLARRTRLPSDAAIPENAWLRLFD